MRSLVIVSTLLVILIGLTAGSSTRAEEARKLDLDACLAHLKDVLHGKESNVEAVKGWASKSPRKRIEHIGVALYGKTGFLKHRNQSNEALVRQFFRALWGRTGHGSQFKYAKPE